MYVRDLSGGTPDQRPINDHCDCDLRHNPTALHHSLVLGNNASDTGSVPLHHFFGEDCRVTAVGRLTQNRVCSGSIPVLYASSIQMN